MRPLPLTSIELKDEEYPSFFIQADQVSLNAQNLYIGLVTSDLFLLALTALISSIEVAANYRIHHACVVSIALLLSAVSTVLLWWLKPEKLWFDGRALAESIKSLTWRYMTGADPFASSVGDLEATFRQKVEEVLKQRPVNLATVTPGHNQLITDKMRANRALQWDNRLQLYLQERIVDQRNWYLKKAKDNSNRTIFWFCAVVVVQVVAIAIAIARVDNQSIPNLIGFLTALATCFISWMQIKRHQELSQSYGLAAQELALIESGSTSVASEATLEQFISEAESAISREHTLWVVRRTG